MNKLLLVLSLAAFMSACTKGTSPSAPVAKVDEEIIPEEIVRVERLVNINESLIADASNVDVQAAIQLSLTGSEKILSKKIILENTGAVDKALQVSSTNPQLAIVGNGCNITLAAGKKCSFVVKFLAGNSYNGSYPSIVNVTADASAQLQVIANINAPGRESPTADGEASALQMEVLPDADFSDFGQPDANKIGIIKITNNDLKKTVNSMLLSMNDPNFSIALSNCPTNLGPKQSCLVRVIQSAATPAPKAELSLVVNGGSSNKKQLLVPALSLSNVALSPDKKVFTLTGSNLKWVKKVEIVGGPDDVMEIQSVSDTQIIAKPSKDVTLDASKTYTLRLE